VEEEVLEEEEEEEEECPLDEPLPDEVDWLPVVNRLRFL
jgi:hypothetical protein